MIYGVFWGLIIKATIRGFPSSSPSQVLDIQSFCQHLPKVELSYTVEAPLTCGSQVNLRNASVEKFNKCMLNI